ncbi:MAG: hypothetical protein AAF614_32760 [Chloroflexota bacterium]
MTVKPVDQVIMRWFSEPAFRNLLVYQPDVALSAYELTYQEREALLTLGRRTRSYHNQ